MPSPEDMPPDATARRLVVVAGSGRSGTSTIAGVLKLLGLHIPQPEVPGNRTNPRGHFEPKWVVDFQQRMLIESQVRMSDARPEAFAQADGVGLRPAVQHELRQWLGEQLTAGREVIVKDPRNSWFLPMWRQGAEAVGVSPGFLTMLRHPAEVVGSKNTYYHKNQTGELLRIGETSRLAGWVNVALFTEYPTRGAPRAFVRYTDLLEDWRAAVASAAESLDLSLGHGLKPELAEEVDAFVEPDLRRIKATWDDLDVQMELKELADDVWQQLTRLAVAGGHDADAEAALDVARASYQRMYADARALAESSVDASVRAAVQEAKRRERQLASERSEAADAARNDSTDTGRTPPGAGALARRALVRCRRVAGRVKRRLRRALGR